VTVSILLPSYNLGIALALAINYKILAFGYNNQNLVKKKTTSLREIKIINNTNTKMVTN
jgi:hypothetical protein